MEEELEQAIHFAFFYSSSSSQQQHGGRSFHIASQQQAAAAAYLETLQQAPERWLLLLQRLPMLKSVEARFWMLQQTLHVFLPRSSVQQRQALRTLLLRHYLSAGAGSRPTNAAAAQDTADEKSSSNNGLGGTATAATAGNIEEEDVAVKNKATLLLVRLIQLDFNIHGAWPSALADVLQAFSAAAEDAAALPADAALQRRQALARIEMCLRLLLVLHQEAIEDPILPRDVAEIKRNAEIRGGLRHYFSSAKERLSLQPAEGVQMLATAAARGEDSSINQQGLWGASTGAGGWTGAAAEETSYSEVLLRVLQLPAVKQTPVLLCLACDVVRRFVGYMSLLLPPVRPTAAAAAASKRLLPSQRCSSSSSNLLTEKGAVEEETAAEPAEAATKAETSGTLVHVLLELWITHPCNEAAEAVAAFAHHKMSPETKARVLCRMGLAEALLTCAPQVAQRPTLVPAFAFMASTTASALFDAVYALRGGDSRLNSSSSSSSSGSFSRSSSLPSGEEQQHRASPLRNGPTEASSIGAAPDAAAASARVFTTEKVAAAAWQRVLLLLPMLTDLFACPSVEISSVVEPFFSFFFNRMKTLQQHAAARGAEGGRATATGQQGESHRSLSSLKYSTDGSRCCCCCGRDPDDCCCSSSREIGGSAALAAELSQDLYLTAQDMHALVIRMLQIIHSKMSELGECDEYGEEGREEQQLWNEGRGDLPGLVEKQQEEEGSAPFGEEDEELLRLQEYRELLNQLFKRVFAASVDVSMAWLRSRIASACERLALEAAPAADSAAAAVPATSGAVGNAEVSSVAAGAPGRVSQGREAAAAVGETAGVWCELGAALSMLLLAAEQYKDLPKLLKDPHHPFSLCLRTLLLSAPLLQQQQQHVAQTPSHVRLTLLLVLVRFASFFQQQSQLTGAALQLILGPAGLGAATVAAAAQEEQAIAAAAAAASPPPACSSSPARGSKSLKLLKRTAGTAAARRGRQRARRRLARDSCIALLRFVKNTQPQVNSFAVPILQVLHQQRLLEVPVEPSLLLGNSRGERCCTAAGQLVEGKLFSFAEQQLIFEAVGLLLGAHAPAASDRAAVHQQQQAAAGDAHLLLQKETAGSTALPAGALSEDTKLQLLQQLLQQLLHAFDVETAGQLAAALQEARHVASKEEELVRRSLWWARVCNAIASFSKGFRPAAAAAPQQQRQQTMPLSSSGAATAEAVSDPRLYQQHVHAIWKNAFQRISYAVHVALGSCSADIPDNRTAEAALGGSSEMAALTSPFLLSLMFLTRRMLFLLHADVLPFLPGILLRLYDPLPSSLVAAAATSPSQRNSAASLPAPAGHEDRSSKAAADFNAQAYSGQLVNFTTHVVVMLRSRVLPADGGFLTPALLARMLTRHFALWWAAVLDTPDLLRDQVERQEQLMLLVECLAKTVPACLLPSFICADPVSSGAAAAAASALHAAVTAAPPSRSSSSDSVTCSLAFQQDPQQTLACMPHPAGEVPGGALAGLRFRDTRNVFVAALQQQQQQQDRHCRLQQQQQPAETAAATRLTCVLLLCCSPACSGDGMCATYAIQSWVHLLHHALASSQSLHLQQVHAVYEQELERQLLPPSPPAPTTEDRGRHQDAHMQKKQQQVFLTDVTQQQALQELLAIVPLRELLCSTSQLILSLDLTNEMQHLRVLSDVLGLWRLLLLGTGSGSNMGCSRKHALAAAAAAAGLPTFFAQLRQLVRLSLQDALVLLWIKPTGQQQQQEQQQQRQREAIAAEAARRLIESLVEIVDGKTSREELRRWVLLQQQQ